MKVSKRIIRIAAVCACASLPLSGATWAATWQMKQRDVHHSGRADYIVPDDRLNSSFFDIFLWQKPAPDSPNDGCFSGTSMTFFDGAGPSGADLVVGTYHWPKGVQGMNRHDGSWFWSGNPAGGEEIARVSPAFSNDGSVLYVTNQYTGSTEYPAGHPCMAFYSADGPGYFWHNGNNQDPDHLAMDSPIVAPDGRIFLHAIWGRPYAGFDSGDAITEVWAAETDIHANWAEPSLYDDEGQLHVIMADEWSGVHCYDGATGVELWSAAENELIDAAVTIDPDNGNIYVGAGDASISVVGIDKNGEPLWGGYHAQVYEHVSGANNPQRVQSCGCLSHDGATYYFQTNSEQGDGALYAIDTNSGSVKWSYPTFSRGWDLPSSCPIVTPNGVIVVGNNLGNTYLALLDEGESRRLLDIFPVMPGDDDQGHAVASATLSPEGYLYLPLRTIWTAGNGDGDIPTEEVANLFSSFDLGEALVQYLPNPPWQAAFALNGSVEVTWREVEDPEQWFDHYAIYRDTQPFISVIDMTPIGTVADIGVRSFTDQTAENGVAYYYAITTTTVQGFESEIVEPIGPRTPFDETDLQVVSISRTPRYPRYLPHNAWQLVTEPSGFGPYYCAAAMFLDPSQDENTQRWPMLGDPVAYIASVRNRGTNTWSGTLTGSWSVDGSPAGTEPQELWLAPNETAVFEFVYMWDNNVHTIGFSCDPNDDRSENDTREIDTRSVAFLSFIDRTRLEVFREETSNYPLAASDDFIDWLNANMDRLNALFEEAGSGKRVHYDVLEVIDDDAEDPIVDAVNFAVCPFRYLWNETSPRLTDHYDETEDLDYDLIHEWGHQLGLIDLHLVAVTGGQNQVNGEGFTPEHGLMYNWSHTLSEHSARAMDHWIDTAHGYYGAYLYSLPEQITLRLIGLDGPLIGADVTVYQKEDWPGVGHALTDVPRAQGQTDGNGEWVLPNVPIDPALVPPTVAGDELRANPFGYVTIIGINGALLMKIEHEGFVDFAWLDITEINKAYWAGSTETLVVEREVCLGGDDIQLVPPDDMAELNAASWRAVSEDGPATATDETEIVHMGAGSVRLDTGGCADNCLRYPADRRARWNLSRCLSIRLWCYAENENFSFQHQSPHIRLAGPAGYIEYIPNGDLLNQAVGQWVEFVIPIDGDETWRRTDHGTVSLEEIHSLRIHADTWDCGFRLWVDGVRFETDPLAAEERERPLTLALGHAAPNPFTAVTELRFSLPTSGPIDLAIYDVAGRRVCTLIKGQMEAGMHEAAWIGNDDEGRSLSSGVYFARLNAGGRSLERKMVLH